MIRVIQEMDMMDMAAESVILRPAEEGDVTALVRLLQRSWLVTWAPELPFDAVKAFVTFDPARAHAEGPGY